MDLFLPEKQNSPKRGAVLGSSGFSEEIIVLFMSMAIFCNAFTDWKSAEAQYIWSLLYAAVALTLHLAALVGNICYNA